MSDINHWIEEEVFSIFRQWGYENPVLVGQGAFARVYRIRERHTRYFCACKVSEKQDMLRREGELLQQISHSLFPGYIQYREREHLSFLFMEYISGENLGVLLARRGWMTERQTVRITLRLAEGLCYLHERSTPILFRDVKPENIMIREDGEVKLLDLGSACPINTVMYAITGTHGYAAPEQWEEQGDVGFHSDVYGLGKVITCMLGNRKITGMYRGIRHLAEECTREKIAERIPNMRILLHKLRPYEKEGQKMLGCLGLKARLNSKKKNEYVYQKNVLRF